MEAVSLLQEPRGQLQVALRGYGVGQRVEREGLGFEVVVVACFV